MKEYDIARALTQVSDDLLLEAENAGRRRKPIKFHRLIAVAAVIAMLAVTVGAVSAGLTWSVTKERGEDVIQKFGGIALDYYKEYDGTQSFDKLELAAPLEKVELPEQNMEKIRALTAQLSHVDRGEVVDFYVQNHIGYYTMAEVPSKSFGSLADVETMLGIGLDVPEALREAIQSEQDDSIVWVRVYAKAPEAADTLAPAKIVVSFQLTGYATNGGASGSITIPLTEEAAWEGMLVVSYSYEREGAIWQEEQTVGGRELVFFGNDPEAGYDGWAEAVYTEGGIGYCISARRDADIPHYSPGWPYYDSAKEMVLSLLTDGE